MDPVHGCARVGQPTRTFIQQLCVDTGYSLEDNDRYIFELDLCFYGTLHMDVPVLANL